VTRRLVAAAALALLALGSARAEEPRKVRLGLDRLRARGVDRTVAETVETRVCAALVERAKDADVVCPSDVDAATQLAKDAMIFGACASDECLKRAEAARAADVRVTGTLERRDGAVVLTLWLARPDAPTRDAQGKLPEGLDGLGERVAAIVQKLLP
jgi:hypothetical protein